MNVDCWGKQEPRRLAPRLAAKGCANLFDQGRVEARSERCAAREAGRSGEAFEVPTARTVGAVADLEGSDPESLNCVVVPHISAAHEADLFVEFEFAYELFDALAHRGSPWFWVVLGGSL